MGSIGVIGATFGLDKAIAKLGIERRVYTAGDRKMTLDPFLPEDPRDVAHIKAIQEIRDATLVLDPGWLEGMTLNTVEPSPVGESSRDGRLALDLGHIPAGDDYLLFLQFQVNPTNVGHRDAGVDLFDGDRRLLHLDRAITVWP